MLCLRGTPVMPSECFRGLERADIPKRLPPLALVNATIHLNTGEVTYIYHLFVLLERFSDPSVVSSQTLITSGI